MCFSKLYAEKSTTGTESVPRVLISLDSLKLEITTYNLNDTWSFATEAYFKLGLDLNGNDITVTMQMQYR